jgi:enolase
MPHIEAIRAQEILDSRGQPTVLAEIRLDNGLCTQAMMPMGSQGYPCFSGLKLNREVRA